MLDALFGTTSHVKIAELIAECFKLIALLVFVEFAATMVFLGIAIDKIDKIKRQFEDWKLQSEARLSPKP